MKKIPTVIMLLAALLCPLPVLAAGDALSGAIGGGAGGAILGQVFGKNTKSTLVGAVVGTALGGVLGYITGGEPEKTKPIDARKVSEACEYTPSLKISSWMDPDTGQPFTVVPQRAFSRNGQPCRKLLIKTFRNGRVEQGRAQACRDEETGAWPLEWI